MVSPGLQTAIEGEANVARYLARLLTPAYDSVDIHTLMEIDNHLDNARQLIHGKDKEKAAVIKTLNATLGKSKWLVGDSCTLADIVLWSAIQQSKQVSSAPGIVKKWIESCNQQSAFQLALRML